MNISNYFDLDCLWALPLTIIAYLLSAKLSQKIQKVLFNTMLMAVLFISVVLLVFHIPYERYQKANSIINYLLQFGVVALALPLYKQTNNILKRWKIIPLVSFIATLLALSSGFIIAKIFGAQEDIIASIYPKSTTTPIALEISKQINGIPAITSACVVIVGIFGAICGHMILKLFKVQSNSSIGMAIGAASHVIGTTRCSEISSEQAAYSSLSLVLCGLWTAIFASFLFNFLNKIF